MLRYATCATAIAALGLASACAPGAISSQRDLHPSYDHMNFGLYHQDRDTRVVLIGDTFGMAPGELANVVTTAMEGQGPGPTNFTASPGPSAAENFRVVLAFNVAPAHLSLCRGETPAQRATNGETRLQAVWCWGDRTESYVRAWTATVKPGDPRFAQLVASTTRELFPTHMDRILRGTKDSGDGPPP